MATPVILPKFDMTMEEGTVIRWLRREGEMVREGDPLVEVMTDKVNMEVEAPASGVLAGLRAQAGERVPVTGVIAYILQPGETVPDQDGDPGAGAARAPATESSLSPASPLRTTGASRAPSAAATPAARRIASEAGLDLAAVPGTGPGGRITEEDVRRALAARSAPDEPLPPRRRVIAERVARSAREIPHIFLMRDVEMSAPASRRGRASYTALVVRAAARALRGHPLMRASFVDGRIQVHEDTAIGVLVETAEGLLAPVLRDAGDQAPEAIHDALQALAARARAGSLTAAEVSGAVFTVSNLGMFGVDRFTSLIYPPQSAILSVGAVRARPWVEAEQVVVRPVCTLTLAVDHRVADGAAGARFLDDLVRELGGR
ncbi:MAG TPA: dihydrolipoamide acetyltransferase family protein [bacterium]|nr:dihydrolipoamide acetyltransferase family protein [bacterium]